MFGELNGFTGLMGLISKACRKSSLKHAFSSLKHVKNRSYGSSGSLKAEVVDENTPRTTGSDLVCVTNLVFVGPAVFARNVNKYTQADRQTSDQCYLLEIRFEYHAVEEGCIMLLHVP